MLSPIQQTIAIDPARQQLTPQTPVAPVAPPPVPVDAPIQASQTPQDQFNPRDGGGNRRDRRDQAQEDRAAAQAADQLRAAWGRLTFLKQQASRALASGNTQSATAAAQEAANLAQNISVVASSNGDSTAGLGVIITSANQISASVYAASADTSTTTTNGEAAPVSVGTSDTAGQAAAPSAPSAVATTAPAPTPAAAAGAYSSAATAQQTSAPVVEAPAPPPAPQATLIDLARSGLTVAKEVVDTAASIPYLQSSEQRAIDKSLQTVLDAMAGVENAASSASGSGSSGSAVAVSAAPKAHLDIKA